VARFAAGAWPPDLSPGFLGLMLRPALETIQISVMGTAIAVAIGLPLGLLATSSLVWRGIRHERTSAGRGAVAGFVPYALARAVLSVFRSIPEYVWAFMFVRAVGLGAFPGVLALGVAYGGMLGKVYSEILEGVNPRPLEALHAGGASKLGIVLYGLILKRGPPWFVGAGGLGQRIHVAISLFHEHQLLTLILAIYAMVTLVDALSAYLRSRLV
jgi:phosphonate transport system permease protein